MPSNFHHLDRTTSYHYIIIDPHRGTGAPDATARPRVIMRFTPDVRDLVISGGLMNGEALAGTPVLIDAPLGDGHVVLFSFDPFHRAFSAGSYSLVFNAIMNFDRLDGGVSPESGDMGIGR